MKRPKNQSRFVLRIYKGNTPIADVTISPSTNYEAVMNGYSRLLSSAMHYLKRQYKDRAFTKAELLEYGVPIDCPQIRKLKGKKIVKHFH